MLVLLEESPIRTVITLFLSFQNHIVTAACSMVLSVVFEQGCVRVTGVPLSAYTGWQHSFLTPTALSRLAVHCRRAAFDKGWLDPSGGFFSLSRDSHRRRVVELEKNAGTVVGDPGSESAAIKADPAQFSTVFIVAMEVKPEVHAAQMPISNNATARGEVFVTAVGSSSFGLGGKFFAVGLDASDPTAEVFLGTVQLSYVHIDFAMRRPRPLPEVKREALEAHLQRSLQDGIGCGEKISRLPKEVFAAIAVAPSALKFDRSFVLRPSDYDFNMHLNQSMYQSFALDTLKEGVLQWVLTALRSVGSDGGDFSSPDSSVVVFLTRLLFAHAADATDAEVMERAARGIQSEDGNSLRKLELAVLQIDSCLSTFRIDYVKEVPMVLSGCHIMHALVEPAADAVKPLVERYEGHAQETCDILFSIASEAHNTAVDGIHSCGVARLTRRVAL